MKPLNGLRILPVQKLLLALAVATSILGFASVTVPAQGAQQTQVSSPGTAGGEIIPLSEDDRNTVDSYLGKGVVGNAVPAVPVIDDVDNIYGLGAGTWTEKLTGGDDIGKSLTRSLAPKKGTGPSGKWRATVGDNLVLFVTKTDAGDIVVPGDIEHDHGVLTRYTPPEPVITKGMKPGQSRKLDIDVKVYDATNPDHLSHSGNLALIYTYAGAYKVTVPAGTFDALLITWQYKGSVGPASVDDKVYRFFAPGIGPVARIELKHISAFLVYNDDEKVGMVLTAHE